MTCDALTDAYEDLAHEVGEAASAPHVYDHYIQLLSEDPAELAALLRRLAEEKK